MNDVKEFTGVPKECTNFMHSPNLEHDTIVKFRENGCLLNSYNVAIITGDLMVEGVLLILSDGKVVNVVRHSWNKRKDTYYDVTKDYVWTSDEFQNKLRQEINGNISYKYLSCDEYKAEEIINGSEFIFKYDYSMLIDCIKEKISHH